MKLRRPQAASSCLVCLALAVVLLPVRAGAQAVTGTLQGTVADTSGGVLPVKFGFPTNDIASANFGRILGGAGSYSPRVVQLVLRYRY